MVETWTGDGMGQEMDLVTRIRVPRESTRDPEPEP